MVLAMIPTPADKLSPAVSQLPQNPTKQQLLDASLEMSFPASDPVVSSAVDEAGHTIPTNANVKLPKPSDTSDPVQFPTAANHPEPVPSAQKK